MALLFLGAKDHRISAGDLDDMREEYARLNIETSRSVLRLYQSRKNAAAVEFRPAPFASTPLFGLTMCVQKARFGRRAKVFKGR